MKGRHGERWSDRSRETAKNTQKTESQTHIQREREKNSERQRRQRYSTYTERTYKIVDDNFFKSNFPNLHK